MRTLLNSFAALAVAAKSNLSGWYVLLALLFLSVLLSGCEKEQLVHTEGGLTSQTGCATEVTAEKVLCGWGAYEDVWFRLGDGTYLQPWENQSGAENISAGTRYYIGYTPATRDDRYKDVLTCMAAVPQAQAIKLTCLKAAGKE